MARDLPEALRFRCRKCGSLWLRSQLVKETTQGCPLCGGQLDPEEDDQNAPDEAGDR